MAPEVIDRFMAEACVTARLEHPNIVPVYEIGTFRNGQPYYTMRIVKQRNLQDVLGEPEPARRVAARALDRRVRPDLPRARLRAQARRPAPRHQAGEHPARRLRRGVPGRLGQRQDDAGLAHRREHEPASLQRAPGREPAHRGRRRARRSASPAGSRARRATSRPSRSAATAPASTTAPTSSRWAWCSTRSSRASTPSTRRRCSASSWRPRHACPSHPRSVAPNCPLVLEDLCLAMLAKDPEPPPRVGRAGRDRGGGLPRGRAGARAAARGGAPALRAGAAPGGAEPGPRPGARAPARRGARGCSEASRATSPSSASARAGSSRIAPPRWSASRPSRSPRPSICSPRRSPTTR